LNTTLEEIIELYLAKIECYDYLNYTEEELLEELRPMLISAVSKLLTLDFKVDFDMEEFNRELTDIEKNIVALGLVEEFITQKTNSIKVLRNHMSQTDYVLYSSANMLKELQSALKRSQEEKSYYEARLSWKKRTENIIGGV
jgi:hypothetical protein